MTQYIINKYSRVAFFGASVTQQNPGYSYETAKLLESKYKVFGFGGMHLPDAGICFIDKVLKFKPNYVFVDWFSTDYMEQSNKTLSYIDTLLYKFSKAN